MVAAGVCAALSVVGPPGALVWAQGTTPIQLEVWPRGAAGDLTKRLLPGATSAVEKAAAGTSVHRYLFVRLEDGTLLVGLDPIAAPFRTPRAAFRPKYTAGRPLRSSDLDEAVGVVGKAYAETHKTPFGYKISEMVYPGHTPRVTLGKTKVEVVGIFESGSADGDQLVVVPLALAQAIAGTPQEVSLLVLNLRPGADAEAVKKAVEGALSGEVEVRVNRE